MPSNPNKPEHFINVNVSYQRLVLFNYIPFFFYLQRGKPAVKDNLPYFTLRLVQDPDLSQPRHVTRSLLSVLEKQTRNTQRSVLPLIKNSTDEKRAKRAFLLLVKELMKPNIAKKSIPTGINETARDAMGPNNTKRALLTPIKDHAKQNHSKKSLLLLIKRLGDVFSSHVNARNNPVRYQKDEKFWGNPDLPS